LLFVLFFNNRVDSQVSVLRFLNKTGSYAAVKDRKTEKNDIQKKYKSGICPT